MDKEKKDEGNSMVEINVDNQKKMIHRGHQSVVEIKTIGNVPLADDLDQVIKGKLVPLADDASITLKGGEIFISHPKDGASS